MFRPNEQLMMILILIFIFNAYSSSTSGPGQFRRLVSQFSPVPGSARCLPAPPSHELGPVARITECRSHHENRAGGPWRIAELSLPPSLQQVFARRRLARASQLPNISSLCKWPCSSNLEGLCFIESCFSRNLQDTDRALRAVRSRIGGLRRGSHSMVSAGRESCAS